MTPDINRLHDNLAPLGDVLNGIEFEFVDDPRWAEPSDISYLNDKDRANPDIMANVDAMDATNKFISWFGRDQDGFVGLWRGPEDTPLEHAPVVRLDSEGQYSLVAATVPDYIAISVMDDDDFDDARAALSDAGFNVASSRVDIWSALDGLSDPNAARRVLYNESRSRRGLTAI